MIKDTDIQIGLYAVILFMVYSIIVNGWELGRINKVKENLINT
tara:strand:- start:902 stop:1030 length:129 start_codon:yes stop_codon:yes gene_type:complete